MNTMPIAWITGGSRGLGHALVKQLFLQGYSVYFSGRDKAALDSLSAELHGLAQSQNMKNSFQSIILDQADLSGFSALDDVLKEISHIDLLINNAAFIPKKPSVTAQGFEEAFGVNYLSHFLLTKKLWSKLQASSHARVINVSSLAFGNGVIDFQQPREWPADGWQAYSNSKLAALLFTDALATRNKNASITINSVCPGIVDSNLLKDHPLFPPPMMARLSAVMQPADVAAEYLLWMSIAPELKNVSGYFFSRSQGGKQPLKLRFDQTTVDQLWSQSMQWVADYPVGGTGNSLSSHPWES
jgi:NAD(P)-dependent dehydrogenase (short-subunit alcohol dehydrogenase family)